MSKQKSMDWGTPESIWELINIVDPDLRSRYFDPCPFPRAEFDGLKIDWRKYNYVNPPFDPSEIEQWINKAHSELLGPNFNRSIMIIPAHTDRIWYRRAVQPITCGPHTVPLYFIGRHDFVPLAGQSVSTPMNGIAMLTFGYEFSPKLVQELGKYKKARRKKKESDPKVQD